MAYAFNQINDLFGQQQQQSNIFGGEVAGQQQGLQTGASAGGEAIGSSQQGQTSVPAIKSAPTASGSAEAQLAQAQKNVSSGAQAKYVQSEKANVQGAIDAAQKQADSFVQAQSGGAPVTLSKKGLQNLGTDTALQSWVSQRLAPSDEGASFSAKPETAEAVSRAKSSLESLGTAEGLGSRVLSDEGGGEFSRRLSKSVARGALGTDVYQQALKEAKEKAEAASGTISSIKSKAESEAAKKIQSDRQKQADMLRKQLESYRGDLIAGAKTRAESAAKNPSLGSAAGEFGKAQAVAALKERFPQLSDKQIGDLITKADAGKFVKASSQPQLDWRQFLGGNAARLSGIESLLGMTPTEAKEAYAGPQMAFDRDAYIKALLGSLPGGESQLGYGAQGGLTWQGAQLPGGSGGAAAGQSPLQQLAGLQNPLNNPMYNPSAIKKFF